MKYLKILLFLLIVTKSWGDGRYLWGRLDFLSELNKGKTILENDITLYHIVNLNNDELRILRNAIYAKHGYQFRSTDLKNYFSKFSWYKAEYSNVDNKLNEIDFGNIQLIQNVERNYSRINNKEIIGLWWDPPYDRRFAVDDAGPDQLRIYPNGIYVIVWTHRLTSEGNYSFSSGLWIFQNNILKFDGELLNINRRESLRNGMSDVLINIDVFRFKNEYWWKYSNNPKDVM